MAGQDPPDLRGRPQRAGQRKQRGSAECSAGFPAVQAFSGASGGPDGGTPTVPTAVAAGSDGSRTTAAEAPPAGSARQTTQASSCRVRLRRPTRVTVAATSTTSPARTGARNCTESYDANSPSSPSVRMQTSVATSPKSASRYAPATSPPP